MGVSVSHTTFVIERDLPGSPAHAFRFWSDHALKRKWNSCHPDWTEIEDRFDFRVGGSEAMRWRTPDGIEHGFVAHYLAIAPGQRIIYAYAMTVDGRDVSASLATVEFTARTGGTRMTFTEQAAFATPADGAIREAGTGIGFERLIAVLEQDLAVVH